MRALPLVSALTLAASPVPRVAHAVERPLVDVSVAAWGSAGHYFVVATCRLLADGRPARTDVYCRVGGLPPEWNWSPAAVNVHHWAGHGPPGTVVCAGGNATYDNLSVVWAAEVCTALPPA